MTLFNDGELDRRIDQKWHSPFFAILARDHSVTLSEARTMLWSDSINLQQLHLQSILKQLRKK